jgi:hypothetical protein
MAWCSVFGPPSGVELHFVKKIEYLCTQSKHSEEMSKFDQPISSTWRWGLVGDRQAIIAPGGFPWRSSSLHPTPPRISGFHSSPVASTTKQQLPVLRPPSSPRDRPTRQEEPGAHPTLSRQFPPRGHGIPQGNCVLLRGGSPARRGQSPNPTSTRPVCIRRKLLTTPFQLADVIAGTPPLLHPRPPDHHDNT